MIALKKYAPSYCLGAIVFLMIAILYGVSLHAVFSYQQNFSLQLLTASPFLKNIFLFSLGQAFLSAILSVLFGALLARALFFQHFPLKNFLLKLFSLTFVLPALVVIFGLLGIFGNHGILSTIFSFFRLPWGNFYGLAGILTAHLFFNLPLACRLFLQSYQSIPPQSFKLASQLNLKNLTYFKIVELPALKQNFFSTFVLIFMLCFTSFTLVLALGGSPKYTTLEVAIYQAIFFDFELGKAALLAIIQLLCCFLLFGVSSFFSKPSLSQIHQSPWLPKKIPATKIGNFLLIFISSLFIFTPLAYTLFSALGALTMKNLLNINLWHALFTSLALSLGAGSLAILMSLGILFATRRLSLQGFPRLAQQIVHSGMVILAIPTTVLALGLFLLLRDWNLGILGLWAMVIFCNALMSLPFCLKILQNPMQLVLNQYEKLALSLGISGFKRFQLIESSALKKDLRYAFALSSCLSLGDFTAIAFFGGEDFTSLPHLLYQQLARYQMQEASLTAGILLLFCGFIFFWVENNDSTRSSL